MTAVSYREFRDPDAYVRDNDNTPTAEEFRAWRNALVARTLAFIESQFARSKYAMIGDLDMKEIDNHLRDGIEDAAWRIADDIEEQCA